MPAATVAELPSAFKNLTPEQKRRGRKIFNALLRRGIEMGSAIRITLNQVKEHEEMSLPDLLDVLDLFDIDEGDDTLLDDWVDGDSDDDDDVDESHPTAMARRRGITRQQADQVINRKGHSNRSAVQYALKTGKLKRPQACTRCGKGGDVEAHHTNARKPLQVRWLCPKCHAVVHPHAPGDSSRESCLYELESRGDEEAFMEPDELDEAVWTTAYVNGLPDSSFLYVEDGEKDDEGKTTPRSKRHLPYKDADGKVDIPHLRAAISRLGQGKTDIPASTKAALQKKAQAMLNKNRESQKEERSGILTESAVLVSEADKSGKVWDVRCIGTGLSKNRTFYSHETLQEAVGLFSGVPCYADHANGPRSIKDVVGWFENARLEADGIYAEFHALEATPWFLGPLKEAFARGKGDLIGFSINGEGSRHADKVDGQLAYVVDRIKAIESVDGVINPSAGGRVVRLVAGDSGKEEEELGMIENLSLEDLQKARPDLYEKMQAGIKGEITEFLKAQEEEATKKREAEEAAAREAEEAKKAEAAKAEEARKEEERQKALSEAEKLEESRKETASQVEKLREEMAVGRSETRVRKALEEDKELPQVIRDKLVRQFSGRVVEDAELKESIEDEKATLRALQDERPTSFPRIETGESQRDRALKALEGLIKGEDVDGIPAARTLREAYAAYKGIPVWSSVDAHEVLRESWDRGYTEGAERLREASGISGATTGVPSGFATWAEVMSEYIHKRLLELYRLPYLEDWRRVASSVISVPDFKTQRRQRLGGYGNFASVGEDVAYPAATTPTDEEATYKVTKYGAVEKMTLEAIANDDVGAIRRIPEQLARGAKTIVYDTVLNLVYNNSTCTYDSASLIDNTNHANAVNASTVDANLSDATLSKAKRLLVEQTEKDSSKPLGLRAKTLLIAPELEPNALRLRDGEVAVSLEGSAETAGATTDRGRDINVHRNSFDYVVVPGWSDAGAWYAIADPGSAPLIEVGFYQGRQEPELFVQDMPNVGSNFDRDEIKYKGRIIFGGVLLDHRGIVGSSQQEHS